MFLNYRGISSVGRALAWHARGHRFESVILHNHYYTYLFSVYILYSQKLDRYYVGYTESLAKRLSEHNSGMSSFTSKASDWELKYSESFETRDQAHTRELEIKKKKSRKYIEWLMLNA